MNLRTSSSADISSHNAVASTSSRVSLFAATLYIHMWVVEGALRKWVPGLDQVMYVARDAVLLVVLAFLMLGSAKSRSKNLIFWLLAMILIIAAGVSVVVAGLPATVALAGIRSYLGPFILVILVTSYCSRESLPVLMRGVLVWIPVQLALGIVQATSSPSAPINLELSGDETRFVQDGIVRITGTFTAPSGLTSFITIGFAVAIGMYLTSNGRKKNFSLAAALALLVLTFLSGSRGAVLAVATIAVVVSIWLLRIGSSAFVKLIAAIAILSLAAWAAAQQFWPDVLDAFVQRFEAADRAENTVARLINQALGFMSPTEFSLLGAGVGGASIVGIALGSGQQWVEIESMRWVSELGLLGLLLAVVRFTAGVALLVWTFLRGARINAISVALVAVTSPTLLVGTLGQNPSYQGFFGIALSLLLVSLMTPEIPHRSSGSATFQAAAPNYRKVWL